MVGDVCRSDEEGAFVSWEYSRVEAVCQQCGKRGVCVEGLDDWGRSSTTWEGFENVSPHSSAIGRKRADSRDMTPLCICGSSNIRVHNPERSSFGESPILRPAVD